jgi:hypothetical protein
MNLEEMREKEVNNLQQEIAEKVVENINLTERGAAGWIRANLKKRDNNPLSGKYTFITKNPVSEELIPEGNKLDFLFSELLELTHKNELTASVYPDKSIKIS